MTDARNDPDEWFEVDFDDNTDGVGDESELSGAPAAFLRTVRELVPTLQQLGFGSNDSSAWYEDGRLTVILYIVDRAGKSVVGCLRLEIGDSGWRGGWVDPGRADQDDFQDAFPENVASGEFTTPEEGAEAAAAWLTYQANRPISRLVWRNGSEVVARLWRLEDTGTDLVASGSNELVKRSETANERTQIRP